MQSYDTLVISGGSMNGVGILGALQYLKDNGLINDLKNFVATSAGTIVCYFLAIGYTPIEIMVYICTNHKIFENLKSVNFLKAMKGEGVISFALISDIIEKMTIDKIGRPILLRHLREIYGKSFTCTTYNLTKNCIEYISDETHPDMPCISAIHMSCNIPVIFEPYKYGECLYIDGGISNNFPIDFACQNGQKIIGLTMNTTDVIEFEKLNIMEYMYKLLAILLNEFSQEKIKNKPENVDVIDVKFGDRSLKVFDFDIDLKTKLGLFSIGYESAKKFYEE